MRFSKNFWLYEFTRSQTAIRRNIDNAPSTQAVGNIRALVANVLQPMRDLIGRPIYVSSGYRSTELNHAIGGSENSQHILGEAADIECFGMSNYALAQTIVDHFSVDQIILEFHNPQEGPNSGWVHVSSKRSGDNRNAALRSFRTDNGVRYESLD